MKKRGQFYLIAALIIIIVIIGLSSLTNYVITKKEPVKFYDLSGELEEEGMRVIDYGIYNEKDIPKLIEDFTSEYFVYYSEEKEKGSELTFVHGNKDNVTVETFTTEKTGEITVIYGKAGRRFVHTGSDKFKVNLTSFVPELVEEEYKVKVYILGIEYNFNLQKGENFLFVITKNTTEETYIVKN